MQITELTVDNSSDLIYWNLPKSRPKRLFVQGHPQALQLLSRLPKDGLAIVGTRQPQLRSTQFTSKLVSDLKSLNLIIVSGLAYGIDGAAHKAALENHTPTIAFLGCGLDQPYPREHQTLKNQILKSGGLLISEYPLGTEPFSGFFHDRNRLIAASAQATLIIEAARKSGALITANWAQSYERKIFALPSFPGDLSFGGNQFLIDQSHAEPLWGSHSVGQVWLQAATTNAELPRYSKKSLNPTQSPSPLIQEVLLASEVERISSTQGAATVQETLEWALSENWSPSAFFQTLQSALALRLIIDQNGLLLKNTASLDR